VLLSNPHFKKVSAKDPLAILPPELAVPANPHVAAAAAAAGLHNARTSDFFLPQHRKHHGDALKAVAVHP